MVHVRALLTNDLHNIIRDRLLLYAAFLIPLLIIVVTRLIFPWISATVYPLEPFYPALFMLLILTIPMMFGFVAAFLIMDERDEGLLTVLRVMPVSRNAFLLYRMTLLGSLSFVYIALFPSLTGLIQIDFINYLLVAVLLALFTPILGLLANIVATNKVQAFAVLKLCGGVFYLPMVALFIDGDFKYVLGVIPNFWTFMAFDTLLQTGSQDAIFLSIGFVSHVIFIGALLFLFNKKC